MTPVMPEIDEVLSFWLGGDADPAGDVSDETFARYWRKDPSFDAELRERFGALAERAARGELDAWAATPRGRVALVILLDQLSRNLYRGEARSFAQDQRAAALAVAGLDAGEHRTLRPMQAYFLIMPLMHAEDLGLQERCVELFDELAQFVSEPGLRKRFEDGADFARRHRDIVARFGRFPHRNVTLSRASTPEELEFLKQPGSGF